MKSEWQYLCEECDRAYKIENGLPFFAQVDSKYDDQIAARWDKGRKWWQRPFVDVGVTWFFAKHYTEKPRVLDIGCGVGLQFHADNSATISGVDLAPSRLSQAKEIYDQVSVASLLELPYEDNTFDVVASVDVLEHIPADVKNLALREMMRVLKDGGRMLHVLDLASQKPLHKWAEKYPELFDTYFIEQMGHYGLETAGDAIRRFKSLGLIPIAIEPTNRTIVQHPENYAWQFDNEYLTHSRRVKFLTSLSYFIRRHKILKYGFAGFYQLIWTRSFEKLFPIDWSFNLAVALKVKK